MIFSLLAIGTLTMGTMYGNTPPAKRDRVPMWSVIGFGSGFYTVKMYALAKTHMYPKWHVATAVCAAGMIHMSLACVGIQIGKSLAASRDE